MHYFRFYTWIKTTEQTQAKPPSRAVDLEALTPLKKDNDENDDDRQVQEKVTDTD